MAFCIKCGQKLEDGVRFCQRCGAPVTSSEQSAQSETQPQTNAQPHASIEKTFRQFTNTNDATAEFDQMDIKNNKAMAVLSYIGILVLIPIFAAKESKFARFHANQGLILLIVSVAYSIITNVIRVILAHLLWVVGSIIGVIFSLVGLVFLALAIIGIVNAANGKAKELPVIGKFRILN